MYNPSATYQQLFRKVVEDMVKDENPLFMEEHQLAMRIIFHMKRPKNHFVGSQPGPGRLKPAAPPRLAPSRTDVDNLAKFVLDSLNGLLYVDDRQVASIFATKIFDNDGHCEGSTEVSIQRLTEEHVDELLQRGLAPYSTMQ
jgi:Holliday junction resolvase RusA-like endonuclease